MASSIEPFCLHDRPIVDQSHLPRRPLLLTQQLFRRSCSQCHATIKRFAPADSATRSSFLPAQLSQDPIAPSLDFPSTLKARTLQRATASQRLADFIFVWWEVNQKVPLALLPFFLFWFTSHQTKIKSASRFIRAPFSSWSSLDMLILALYK